MNSIKEGETHMQKRLVLILAILLGLWAGAAENAVQILSKRNLLTGKGDMKPATAALAGKKLIGIYYSAHWCGPCRAFTPKLVQFYNQCKEKKLPFELVFVSFDNSSEAMREYMKDAKMPWLAVPYADREGIKALGTLFAVRAIPTLIIVDDKGNVVSSSGREEVASMNVKAYEKWQKATQTVDN
jgi:nucleoredoxin